MIKKEYVTAQQAWDYVEGHSTRKLVGLDINDYKHSFFVGEEKKVLMMTMSTKEEQYLPDLIDDNYDELLRECRDAKKVVIQLYCGKGFQLMMDDMNCIHYFVESFGDAEFTWGLENVDTEDFLLQVCVFAIK